MNGWSRQAGRLKATRSSALSSTSHVFPTREMRRRRRSGNGQNAEQCAVDMKRMCHSNRHYLPDLAGSELGLDIDTFHVKRLSIYPCEGDHVGMLASLSAVHANSAVHNELSPPHRRSLKAAESSTSRVGISLTRGFVAVVSNRITGT
jgi:hypothetical protein